MFADYEIDCIDGCPGGWLLALGLPCGYRSGSLCICMTDRSIESNHGRSKTVVAGRKRAFTCLSATSTSGRPRGDGWELVSTEEGCNQKTHHTSRVHLCLGLLILVCVLTVVMLTKNGTPPLVHLNLLHFVALGRDSPSLHMPSFPSPLMPTVPPLARPNPPHTPWPPPCASIHTHAPPSPLSPQAPPPVPLCPPPTPPVPRLPLPHVLPPPPPPFTQVYRGPLTSAQCDAML